MITKEQIVEILFNHSSYFDSSLGNIIKEERHQSIADEILTKLSQHGVNESVCDNCQDVQGMYLGMTCPKCNRPFRSVKKL